MRETLVVCIDPPLRGSAQNTRRHWRVRHRADKLSRCWTAEFAKSEVRKHSWATADNVRIHVDWYMGPSQVADYYRPLDVQNAIGSLKAAVDGLVDAGVVVSDTHKHLKFGDVRLHRTQKEHGGRTAVVFTIERLAS